MRQLFIVLSCFLAVTGFAQDEQNIATGGWRIHLPYASVTGLAETTPYLYVSSSVGLYRFDKKSGEVEILSKVNGFSDVEVTTLSGYNEQVFMGYANTNIDILKDGVVTNISDIFRKPIVGIKRINDVSFYNNRAYVSCTFGIVIIDLERQEVVESFLNLGSNGSILNVQNLVIFNNTFMAGTPDGVYTAPVSGANLNDFNNWNKSYDIGDVTTMVNYDNSVIAVADSVLMQFDGSSWTPYDGQSAQKDYRDLGVYYDQLAVSNSQELTIYSANGKRTIGARESRAVAVDNDGSVWTGGNYTGLIKIDQQSNFSYLTPNGPFKSAVYELQGFRGEIWGSSGGFSPALAPVFENGGYYHYKNSKWSNLDRSNPILDNMYDFTSIAIDRKSGEVFLGTHGAGIAHMNADGTFKAHYTSDNSTINSGAGAFQICLGLAVDEDRNLWVANHTGDPAMSVRKPDGTWVGFDVNQTQIGEMVIDRAGNKWMVIPRDETKGIYVMKELNIDDGVVLNDRILNDQTGQGALPSNTVNALALDQDGEVWVGTDQGIAIFSAGVTFDILDINSPDADIDAFRPTIDDGQDIGYLLGTQVINDIKVDPANRKWVATNNGAWLVAENGQEVIRHWTSENSPLLSNTVRCVGINEVSGEVFFGTSKGIISYRSDATAGSDVHGDVVVFPNPVRENFEGVVTITGLPDNATVKITDVAGRVVYETLANGGTATWNGRNFNGEKPMTGVYLVFSSNRDGDDAMVSKFLFIH
jgi:ligand-binding sensor domain-containing protein